MRKKGDKELPLFDDSSKSGSLTEEEKNKEEREALFGKSE